MTERMHPRFTIALSIDLGVIGQRLTIELGGGGRPVVDRSDAKEEE
ncbi:hypothetical protein KJ567_01855 [Candidatus Bipolaricaulota bacterium]|nr:hypothetical protein [Candidatus Bipolaricaulota bacterium]